MSHITDLDLCDCQKRV